MSSLEIIDPQFANLIPGTSHLEQLWTGARWTEGPVYFGDLDVLLFSDIPNNRIMCLTADNQVSTFRQPSNFTNGNTRDCEGRLVSCQHGSRAVVRTEHDGTQTTIADSYNGKRLNSPNDVVVKSDGSVWFTDPSYGILSDYEGFKSPMEQDGCYVYRVDPGTGAVEIAVDDFVKPNGLAFSPDESVFYVSDSAVSHDPSAPHHIRAFDVGSDGRTLTNDRVFAVVSPGLPDGFRLDTDGRLWTSAADGVHCYTADGNLLGKVLVPEAVANLTFGGPRRNRLFITGTTSVYARYTFVNGAQRP